MPVTTGPQDPAAAGRGRLRAGHADREQVIEALKDAFVQGRLTRDELDARVAQTLVSRTYAGLAALTADIPPAPAAAGLARPPTPARRWPLVRAAAGSGGCLVIAAAAFWGATILDPGPPAPSPDHHWVPLMLLIVLAAVLAALGILANGVVTSWEQRRSRRRLPPRPGPGGHALDGERRGGTGHGPVPPGPRPDQASADLRAHKSPQHRPHIPARAGRAPRGVRPEPGAV
jgi:Domain of unknown function (DUF1707)